MARLAANLSMMYKEHDFLQRFAAARAAGFGAVEFLFPYDYPVSVIADSLQQNGLEPALFNLPPGNWDSGDRGLAALHGADETFRKSVALALEYAAATGVRKLHMMAGIADRSVSATRAKYRDALDYAAEAAGSAGIEIMIEPINSRDMPGYFLNDFNFAADIIGSFGHANVKLQYDIYHRQIIHGDVIMGLRQFMPIVGHVQIASVPERHEPLTGELDDRRILGELDRLGYHGYVGCEYNPAGETDAGLTWISELSGK
ncbi:2-oxo-tetronate isomerase [Rhizobium sp. 21-4511-3d]|jgi:hydroxypyruvate isomerase